MPHGANPLLPHASSQMSDQPSSSLAHQAGAEGCARDALVGHALPAAGAVGIAGAVLLGRGACMGHIIRGGGRYVWHDDPAALCFQVQRCSNTFRKTDGKAGPCPPVAQLTAAAAGCLLPGRVAPEVRAGHAASHGAGERQGQANEHDRPPRQLAAPATAAPAAHHLLSHSAAGLASQLARLVSQLLLTLVALLVFLAFALGFYEGWARGRRAGLVRVPADCCSSRSPRPPAPLSHDPRTVFV